MSDSRIVCAKVHNKSGEVEIIVDVDGDGFFTEDDNLFVLWLTKEEIIERGTKFVRAIE